MINSLMQEWLKKNQTKVAPENWGEEYNKEYDRIVQCILKEKWALSFRDRGMGYGDFGINTTIDGKQETILECPCREVAEHIIRMHNLPLGFVEDNSTKE